MDDNWQDEVPAGTDEVEVSWPPPEFQQGIIERAAQQAAGYIKRHGVRVVIVSAASGIIIGGIKATGVEVGWPVVCATLGATEAGILALGKAVRCIRKSGDQRGIGIVKR